ncbi:hypothetical protein B0H11DRAFT_2261256 [Mycena galericulata]|nr:hypothetical protein B0H11DRAFT_2261256 [Mycena galericulata]
MHPPHLQLPASLSQPVPAPHQCRCGSEHEQRLRGPRASPRSDTPIPGPESSSSFGKFSVPQPQTPTPHSSAHAHLACDANAILALTPPRGSPPGRTQTTTRIARVSPERGSGKGQGKAVPRALRRSCQFEFDAARFGSGCSLYRDVAGTALPIASSPAWLSSPAPHADADPDTRAPVRGRRLCLSRCRRAGVLWREIAGGTRGLPRWGSRSRTLRPVSIGAPEMLDIMKRTRMKPPHALLWDDKGDDIGDGGEDSKAETELPTPVAWRASGREAEAVIISPPFRLGLDYVAILVSTAI